MRQLPGHAEVEHQRVAAIGVDQPVFRAAAKPDDPRAGQPLAEVQREGPPEVGPARLDARDAPAVEHAREAANGGLDFGKLGHRRDMAEARQPR